MARNASETAAMDGYALEWRLNCGPIHLDIPEKVKASEFLRLSSYSSMSFTSYVPTSTVLVHCTVVCTMHASEKFLGGYDYD